MSTRAPTKISAEWASLTDYNGARESYRSPCHIHPEHTRLAPPSSRGGWGAPLHPPLPPTSRSPSSVRTLAGPNEGGVVGPSRAATPELLLLAPSRAESPRGGWHRKAAAYMRKCNGAEEVWQLGPCLRPPFSPALRWHPGAALTRPRPLGSGIAGRALGGGGVGSARAAGHHHRQGGSCL